MCLNFVITFVNVRCHKTTKDTYRLLRLKVLDIWFNVGVHLKEAASQKYLVTKCSKSNLAF